MVLDRLEKEFEEYKKEALNKSPEELFDLAYAITIRKEIVETAEYHLAEANEKCYTNLENFRTDESLLEFLADIWMNCDGGLDSVIWDSITAKLS